MFERPLCQKSHFLFIVAGSQDGRTAVLEKEKIEVDESEEAEGVIETIKNAVG